MLKNHLIVSEVFYSIQGEGQTMGIPAVFLRLGGCNLLCNGAGWRCDTIEVWQKGKHTEFSDVLFPHHIIPLKHGAHLIITGGEPMLHQHAIVDYLNWFRAEHKFTPIIEIETNGTIIPTDHMIDKVDYWNISPKLSSVGEPYEKRVNEIAIARLLIPTAKSVSFKFVISSPEDILEIGNEWSFIPHGRLIFMPAGDTQEKLNRIREMVIEACKSLQVRYCDRLHIVAYNQKTGV